MLKIVVTGGRDYTGKGLLKVLRTIYAATPDGHLTIIHGGCPTGADAVAHSFCRSLSVNEQEFKADWDQHGKYAGPLRNLKMLCESKPNLVIATSGGRGTANCVERSQSLEIPVLRIEE